jgi:hypothetical protein
MHPATIVAWTKGAMIAAPAEHFRETDGQSEFFASFW